MSKITVVTTTYNRPKTLSRTIDSVLNQTFTDFTYLIIDNGSQDAETLEILRKYAKQDARIVFCSYRDNDMQESSKLWTLAALQFSADRTQAYQFVIDDDDYMEPQTLSVLYAMALETGSDIVTVGSRYVFPDGSMKDKYVYDGVFTFSRVEAMRELLKREKFNSSRGGKLYRSSILQNITYPPQERRRDIVREYRVVNNIKSMTVSGEPLFYFSRHDSNMSGLDTAEQITPEKMREHLHANRIRTEWLAVNMPEMRDFAHYSEAAFMLSLCERITRLQVEICYPFVLEMQAWLRAQRDVLLHYPWFTEREKGIWKAFVETE